jgi:hypothetical protein
VKEPPALRPRLYEKLATVEHEDLAELRRAILLLAGIGFAVWR